VTGNKHCRIVILLLSVSVIGLAQNVGIGSYPVTAPNSGGPQAITRGPDGALWFTIATGSIGRMNAAAAYTEYAIPTPNSNPQGITAGPDGALWFTESGSNKIGRITTAGTITEFPVTTANSSPWGITAGPNGALWFTENAADQIGTITTGGTVTEYRNPYGTEPAGITAGPNGALWFTEYIQVGTISTTGTINSWNVTSTSNSPQAITTGPDGALWFTEAGANQIGRITTAGVTTEYPVFDSEPLAITRGADGALWFTDSYSNSIGRITTAGVVTNYLAPPTNFDNTGTTGITNGPDSALWFTENGAGMVGEAVFLNADLTVSPTGGHPGPGGLGTSIAFSGSLFGASEAVDIYKNGVGSAVIVTGATNSSGSFSTNNYATLPPLPFGYHLFLAVGQTSGKRSGASFSITPELVLDPNYASPGGTVTATGVGFAAFDTIQVYWENPLTLLGTAVTNVSGSFNPVTFTVPSGAGLGYDGVTAMGTNVPQATATAYVSVQ
jgi:virginiamycin B lyase